jgi:hypothetical protein
MAIKGAAESYVSISGKVGDCWVMTSPLGTPRGRCDEYSSKVFPQLETKVYRSGEERQTTEGDAC